MDWALPPDLSTQGVVIDRLFWIILAITGIAFLLVEAGILWFAIRYRRRDGRQALYTHGSKRLEVAWTAAVAVTMVVLGIYSGQLWNELKGREAFAGDAFRLDVAAKQFEWNITYPGADGRLGNADDFTLRNQLHVPTGEKVIVRLTSEDVIHSFFVPQLRVKQDAVPGMTTRAWFRATEPGEFELGCAELCGLGHYRMRARVTVHEPEEFRAWMAEHAGGGRQAGTSGAEEKAGA